MLYERLIYLANFVIFMEKCINDFIRLKIKGSQISCENSDILNCMGNEVRDYLLRKYEESKSFFFYTNEEVYRCYPTNSEILCIRVSDLISRIAQCESELKKEMYREKDALALMDIIIHNIKNYLFLMEGFVEVDNGESAENIKKLIEDIRSVIRKAYIFLLSPDRLAKNKIRLASMIDDIFISLQGKAMEKKVKLRKRCRNIVVYGDEIIKEAIFNIVDNAVKYTSEGSEVTVECEKDSDSVIIKVRDQGKGIPPELKELLFERFKRGKESVGMGLGLAITRHIVEMHNGEIWVEDNSPRGSVFCIRLPQK